MQEVATRVVGDGLALNFGGVTHALSFSRHSGSRGALAQADVAVNAGPLVDPATAVPSAPIGHLQPAPSSFLRALRGTNRATAMSIYDAEQQKLDKHSTSN